MEKNVQNQQESKNSNLRTALIALGILLVLALAAMIFFIFRGNRLNTEKENLQETKVELNEENQQLLTEKNELEGQISECETDLGNLKADFQEQLDEKDSLLSAVQVRGRQVAQLRDRIQQFKVMEDEFEKLQINHSVVLAEKDSLDRYISQLSDDFKSLRDSVEKSRELQVYNINTLTRWDRWLWADRYNISKARRVDETNIDFVVAGTPFSTPGINNVYLRMIDRHGSLMYPADDTFENDETGEEISFTVMREIVFDGDPVPLEFTIWHDGLEPGTYEIEVFIDGKLKETHEMNFE